MRFDTNLLPAVIAPQPPFSTKKGPGGRSLFLATRAFARPATKVLLVVSPPG